MGRGEKGFIGGDRQTGSLLYCEGPPLSLAPLQIKNARRERIAPRGEQIFKGENATADLYRKKSVCTAVRGWAVLKRGN